MLLRLDVCFSFVNSNIFFFSKLVIFYACPLKDSQTFSFNLLYDINPFLIVLQFNRNPYSFIPFHEI